MKPRARVVGQVDPKTLGVTEVTGRLRSLPPLDGIRRLHLKDVEAEGVSFANIRLDGLVLLGQTRLIECDFSGARFAHVGFDSSPGAALLACTFDECRFPTGVTVGPTRFERCRFRTNMKDWISQGGEFINCRFAGELDNCTFFGTVVGPWKQKLTRTQNVLSENDFRDAKLLDCGFRAGVDLPSQHFPAGCYLVSRLDDLATRLSELPNEIAVPDSWVRSVGALIAMYQLFQSEGQGTVLVNLNDFPPMDARAREQVESSVASLDIRSVGA